MNDAFARTRLWNVSFRFSPPRDGIKHPGFVAVMNAIQDRGWRPSLSEPNDDGWFVVTCEGVEAERGDQAEALVQSVAIWAGTGGADDFTVRP